jgi:hypothetical protein
MTMIHLRLRSSSHELDMFLRLIFHQVDNIADRQRRLNIWNEKSIYGMKSCVLDKFTLTSLLSRVYSQQVSLTSFLWQVYFLVCTVNKVFLTSLLSRVYSQQVSFDKFPWQVYFLVCTVNKFSLTSLLSRVYSQQVSLTSLLSCVYSQQVFLDKFTFLCVQSTTFPWQVYLLVCTVNKFSLTSLLSRVYSKQVSLTSLLSCVYSQQVGVLTLEFPGEGVY